uniref:uncharacterized protein LOC143412144 n=1 Tax=Callospermophilus lateralis TaxID=76772 RepID=UPI0040385DFC
MATFRLARNRGPSRPEMKSPAQPTWDYRIISLSCARRQRRAHDPEETAGPRHGCLASGLQVTRAARPRGGPGRIPASAPGSRAAATGARHNTRREAADGPVPSGDRDRAQERVTRRTPGGPRLSAFGNLFILHLRKSQVPATPPASPPEFLQAESCPALPPKRGRAHQQLTSWSSSARIPPPGF